MDKYVHDLIEYVRDLDVENPIDAAQSIIDQTNQHQLQRVDILKEAISRILIWNGSKVTLQPGYSAYSWKSYYSYAQDPFDPILTTYVTLTPTNSLESGMDPSFTWFSDNEIDDIIDVGDTDFFTDLNLQNDYFSLIRELKSPGSTQKSGKVLRLFTARPISDRKLYAGATTIPSGIFLANSASHVAGLAIDLAETNEPRDIYKVKIYEKYVILSQDLGYLKYYQTIGNGEVPVISINLY